MDAFKYRKFTVTAVMFLLITAPETRGFSAYLKQIGPSPLRFSLATAVPSSFVLPPALVEPPKPTNTTETAVSPAISSQTNALPATPVSTPATNAQPTVSTTEPATKPTPTPSASELLPVSPQMLTEYFKPVAESTNAATNVGVPVTPLPVGFTPPLVKPPSRATYNNP
jgi:hypothetical protein